MSARAIIAFASYALTPKARGALRAFAGNVKSLHVRLLTLLGYTDDMERPSTNKTLSRERAATVGNTSRHSS